MKISIVTAVWNGKRTVECALESVRRQKLPDGVEIEHVVEDGVSTDGTLDIIRRYAERSETDPRPGYSFRWRSERDAGLYDGINKGIALATGDIIGMVHADDALADDWVIADIAAAFSNAETAATYGDVRFVRNERGGGNLDEFRALPTVRYYSSGGWKPWMHNFGFMPAHPSIYVRRHVYERYGNYPSNYRVSGDFAWMTRMFCGRRGEKPPIRPVYLRRVIVEMGLGGASTGGWNSLLTLNRENVTANRDLGYYSSIAMMMPKYLYKIFGYLLRRNGK